MIVPTIVSNFVTICQVLTILC